jgi:hypothetical protein
VCCARVQNIVAYETMFRTERWDAFCVFGVVCGSGGIARGALSLLEDAVQQFVKEDGLTLRAG